jgi:hypothetical protein
MDSVNAIKDVLRMLNIFAGRDSQGKLELQISDDLKMRAGPTDTPANAP